MIKKINKNELRIGRHQRIRNNLSGTAQTPRLAVYRSLNGIYAQIINDEEGITLVSCSTLDKDLISKKVVSIFVKEKTAMRAGETDKAKSIKSDKLFNNSSGVLYFI